jgi:PAS domain S-box-containing protein
MNPPKTSERKLDAPRSYLGAPGIALLYAVVGGLWIWLSDTLLAILLPDPAQFATWQTYKGWLFVIFSALLLWSERAWSDRRGQAAQTLLRARMEQHTSELERVRVQLQLILDNAPVSFAMRSVDNRYMLVNRRWEEYMGISREQVLGKTPAEFFAPDVARALLEDLARVLDQKEGIVEEVPIRLRGQDYVFVRASFPLYDETGKPYAGIDLATDISARKEVEESLRQAEERFRAVFQTVGLGIVLVDASGRYIGANSAFQKMLGYDESTLLTKYYQEITYPPDLVEDEKVTKYIEENPQQIGEIEKRYVRADGTLVWARLLISAIHDSDGALVLYVTVVEEITARKEAETQHRLAQAELEQLVAERTVELQRANDELAEAQRIAHFGNWSLDLETSQLEWSAETYRIFGYEPHSLQGTQQTFLDCVHPDDRPLIEEIFEEALTERQMREYEHRVVRPSGEIRTVRERGYVVRDEKDRPIRIFGTVQDVTERRRAEAEIRAVNDRLSAILKASPSGIIALDTQGLVQLWNPAAEQIYGYPAREVLGKPVPDLQAPGDLRYDEIRRQVLSGDGLVGLETQRKRHDGTVIDVMISTAPLRDGNGAFAGTVALVRDITARKQAEAEVLRLNQELEARVIERTAHLEHQIAERMRAEAEVKELNATLAEQAQYLAEVNRELETFTYSVSHDLKAPLRGIDGYSRLLLEDHAGQLDEEGRDFLNTIRSATTQMAQLIDDLLAYSRVERRTLALGQIELRQFVETLLFEMQPEQTYPHTTVDVTLEPVLLSADSDALALVLRNLIDNALKFSAGGSAPHVEIGGERTAQGYRLFVCDNGVGFDMQYQERIFDIFQRLHRAEEYPGTGIGLAIVRRALQRMQGQVWSKSQPGQGATFFVEIPTL